MSFLGKMISKIFHCTTLLCFLSFCWWRNKTRLELQCYSFNFARPPVAFGSKLNMCVSILWMNQTVDSPTPVELTTTERTAFFEHTLNRGTTNVELFLFAQLRECSYFRHLFHKFVFLDCSGVFWGQLNCSNLFPESSLLRKNQCICSIGSKCHKIYPETFVFKNWKVLIFSHYLGKIAGLCPAIFSGTPRNSDNQY